MLNELKADRIEFETDEKVAVFLTQVSVSPTETQPCWRHLGYFEKLSHARSFIKDFHRKGNEYFICTGICMG